MGGGLAGGVFFCVFPFLLGGGRGLLGWALSRRVSPLCVCAGLRSSNRAAHNGRVESQGMGAAQPLMTSFIRMKSAAFLTKHNGGPSWGAADLL